MDITIEVCVWESHEYGVAKFKLDIPASLVADIQFDAAIKKMIAEAAAKAEIKRFEKEKLVDEEIEQDGQS